MNLPNSTPSKRHATADSPREIHWSMDLALAWMNEWKRNAVFQIGTLWPVAVLRGGHGPPSFLLNFTFKFAWLAHTADNFRPARFYVYVDPPTFFLGPAVAPPLLKILESPLDHRRKSRQILGGANNFFPNSHKLAQKNSKNCDPKTKALHVILDAIFFKSISKQFQRHFLSYIQGVCSDFQEFCEGFQRFCPKFHGFCPDF